MRILIMGTMNAAWLHHESLFIVFNSLLDLTEITNISFILIFKCIHKVIYYITMAEPGEFCVLLRGAFPQPQPG